MFFRRYLKLHVSELHADEGYLELKEGNSHETAAYPEGAIVVRECVHAGLRGQPLADRSPVGPPVRAPVDHNVHRKRGNPRQPGRRVPKRRKVRCQ